MQNENNTTIEIILATCSELGEVVSDYCDGHSCFDCELQHTNKTCRYMNNLLMLLHGYRMGTCDPAERQQIDDYMSEKFPAITKRLQNINH